MERTVTGKKREKRRAGYLTGLSPWFILGAAAIIIVIFALITYNSIKKQRDYVTGLLLAQGEALILSFEAGARTAAGMKWGPFELQKLLVEMAQQPDLDYILVVNKEGLVLVDSDPAMVGETYGTDLELKDIAMKRQLQWRIVSRANGTETFEVFRQFFPFEAGHRGKVKKARPETEAALPDWEEQGLVIFVGMNLSPLRTAKDKEIYDTIIMAAIMLFIGLAGIVSFFLAQAYRSTRLSLAHSRAFATSIIDNMPLALLAFDEEGQLAAANRETARILRVDPARELGKKKEEILPPVLSQLSLPDADKEPFGKEIVLADKTVLEVIVTVLKYEDGSSRGEIMLLRDITELRQLKDEIARSQRLASLGNLAAGVAHEIRNPLSSIKGFATYFRERLSSQQDAETAEIMIQEVDRLNRVIQQLLQFARPKPPDKRILSLNQILAEGVEVIGGTVEKKGVSLTVNLPKDNIEIYADGDQIKQVLWNLCLNALDATAQGGQININLARTEDNQALITVADTGRGIAEADIPHLFDPYFTTKSSGTGLGLAIVHRIVEAHGGEIRIDSILEKGSSFHLYFPLATRVTSFKNSKESFDGQKD